MSYPINITIPATNDDPADDQPLMQGNFQNINSLFMVDHVEGGTPGNGQHEQVTYFQKNGPFAPAGQSSVAFTAAGTDDPTNPQHFWQNAVGIFPLSAIRAFVIYSITSGGTVSIKNKFNIVSVTTSSHITTITLTPNCTSSADYCIFVNGSQNTQVGTWTNTQSTITLDNRFNPTTTSRVSVLVIQI